MSLWSEEYRHILAAERAMAKLLEKEDLKGAEGAQVTRALCDAVRLKRDMRGIPDPKPQDMSVKTKQPRPSPLPIDPSANDPVK